MGEEAIKAANAAGWEPTEVLDGEFNPAVQSKRIQQLVQEKVDAIVLISIQPETVAGPINEAIEAGIPITDIYTSPDKQFKSWGEPMTMVTSSGVEQGEFVGTYIAANVGEMKKVTVLGDSPEFPILEERVDGLEKALGEQCPDCTIDVTQMASAELAKPGPPPLNALLSTNPVGSLEWFVGGPTDPYGSVMMETIEQLGRDDLKMVGIDTAATMLENLSEGGVVQADVYSPFRYAAWAGVEMVIRESVGLKPWKADRLPPGYIVADNVEEALSEAPKSFNTPGFDYEAIFEELWSGK
jgi:ABC-type sugar transport system substrate-binding protein